MSLSVNKIETVRINDPVLDFNEKRLYGVLTGGRRTSFKPIISTSYSNSSAVFSAPPPNPSIAVSRNIKVLQPVTIAFEGTAPAGQALLQSGYDAFRAYPLASNMNTVQVDLNNVSFSLNISDYIQALLRYHNPDQLKDGDMSMTPSTLDKSQQYSDLQGSIRNPLAAVVDSPNGGLDGRGAFPLTSITNNVSIDPGATTTATLAAVLTECLFISPLQFGSLYHENGFIGLQTMQVTINWDNDLRRIWCHDSSGGTILTSITVTLGQPILLMEYKTPSQIVNVPKFRQYGYSEIQRYPTDAGSAFAANETRLVSSSNIQLNSIPRMMYIFARKRNSDRSYESTDTFFSIEQISVNWANNSGLLSNARKQDLYEMSRKNGCSLNWRDWSGEASYFLSGSTEEKINGVGSVLAVEFGTDLCVDEDEAPGLNGTYQLQMEVLITNRNSIAITPTLYIVVANEGLFTLENNSAYSQIGVINRNDVIMARKQEGLTYSNFRYMAGGSWFKKFAKKLSHAIKQIRTHGAPILREGVKTYKEFAPIIKAIMAMYGAGEEEAKLILEKYGPEARDMECLMLNGRALVNKGRGRSGGQLLHGSASMSGKTERLTKWQRDMGYERS